MMHAFISAWLPELIATALAFLILLVAAFGHGRDRASTAIGLALFGLLVVGVILVRYYMPMASPQRYVGMYRISAFTGFAKLLLVISAFLALMLARRWAQWQTASPVEYPALMLLATVGLMLLVSADHLLAFYIALELASLCMYVMAAYQRRLIKPSEAGLKYFILSSLSSGMLLYGMSLVYGFSGALTFGDIAAYLASAPDASLGLVLGMVLILIGISFKLSAVPFHMWTPDVYAGAPTPVVAFFATAPKLAVICLLMRLLYQVFPELAHYWRQVVVVASVGSMLVGALAGLVQSDIKRLLAYSSIGHMGYALLGVAAGTQEGAHMVLIYLTVYIFMTAGVFACLMLLRRGGEPVTAVEDLAGLSKSHPKIALAMVVLLFSMAGIPPFAGFFAKLFVFGAAVKANLTPAVVLGVISSVVACYYYLRLIKVMYFEQVEVALDAVRLHALPAYVLLISLGIHAFVLAPDMLSESAAWAARSLFP